MLITAQMRRRGTHVKPCVRHFNMSILGAADGKGQGMQEKLNMRQLFVDAFGFLREQILVLLPLLLVAIASIKALEFAVLSLVGSAWSVIFVKLAWMMALAGVAVIAYQRAIGRGSDRQWLSSTISLTIATILIGLLFVIIGVLLVLLLVMITGIVLGADGLGGIEALDAFEDFYSLIAEMSTAAEIVIGILALASGVGLVWISVRLVLFGIATVAQERLMIFRTWNWTKGHAVRIFVFYAIFTSPIWFLILYASIGLVGSDDVVALSAFQPEEILFDAVFLIVNFLFGHAAAIAVYKQLVPETENYEAAFS